MPDRYASVPEPRIRAEPLPSGAFRFLPILGGLLLLVAAGALVRDPPAAWEEAVFRAINDLPRFAEHALWVLQQMGSALVLPVAAAVLWWLTRRWQPPVAILLTGFFAGWLAAKGIKAIVGRGRPPAMLDDVNLGYDVPVTEVGFPSGHVVMVFTLAVVFAPYLSRAGRVVVFTLATAVALTRIYVGAHLPLDCIGGAGYGVTIGTLTRILSEPRAAPFPRGRDPGPAG